MALDLRKKVGQITFKRTANGKDLTVEIFHPFQPTKREDGKIEVVLPLFGNLKTIAKNEADITIAIQEALECYFDAIVKFGGDFEKEFKALGWQAKGSKLKYKVKTANTSTTLPQPKHSSYAVEAPKTPGLNNLIYNSAKSISSSLSLQS